MLTVASEIFAITYDANDSEIETGEVAYFISSRAAEVALEEFNQFLDAAIEKRISYQDVIDGNCPTFARAFVLHHGDDDFYLWDMAKRYTFTAGTFGTNVWDLENGI